MILLFDYFYPTGDKKMPERALPDYELFSSVRYVVKGSIGVRVVIYDLEQQVTYTLAHSDLPRFRAHWLDIKWINKEAYLHVVTASRIGTPWPKIKTEAN